MDIICDNKNWADIFVVGQNYLEYTGKIIPLKLVFVVSEVLLP